ncbi:UNVERIFIED_CONTAM: KappaPI-actitoxin-Avd3d [Trichonephila clavipes]
MAGSTNIEILRLEYTNYQFYSYFSLTVCNEVKAVGNCNNNIERYYYNIVEDKCEKFMYSGCNGNNNNFDTLQECEKKCQGNHDSQPTIQRAPIGEPDRSSSINCNLWLILITVILTKLHSIFSTYSKTL